MTRRSLSIVALLSLLLTGCELVGPEEEQTALRALTAAEQQTVGADNRFGLNLFRAVSEAEAGENTFVSPLSISMALGMTLNGADGETYEAMRETLEKQGLSRGEINEAYESLIELLRNLDPEVVFEIANSIWYREGFQVEPEFVDVNKTHFDAEVRGLDFADPGAVDAINGWVDEKTHGKIEEIVEKIGGHVVMYLINAIYFNGTWTYEFDEERTRNRPFTALDGTQKDVPMMAQEADLAYFATERFQAVDLPYGDGLYSMTVILPREGEDLGALIADLNDEMWNGWTGQLQSRTVDLRLPRFKLEYKIELADVLSALGMEVAFEEGRADFTRINKKGGLFISRVLHKTFVEVDEQGTEAAAVTAVEIGRTSVGGGAVSMHVDRPFLFVIREQHSGTLLFIGKVVSL